MLLSASIGRSRHWLHIWLTVAPAGSVLDIMVELTAQARSYGQKIMAEVGFF